MKWQAYNSLILSSIVICSIIGLFLRSRLLTAIPFQIYYSSYRLLLPSLFHVPYNIGMKTWENHGFDVNDCL